ncbi:MAG: UMP kinase [Sphaerochaetaceae bacterium]
MLHTTVLSLGGSIISPKEVDIPFLTQFVAAMGRYLTEHEHTRLIIVTGGGSPARLYQQAYKEICDDPVDEQLDLIGIAATRLNGSLLRALFDSYCDTELVTDPTADFEFNSRVLIASGWKPGFSSDTDAVYLAKRFHSPLIINLSNVKKVYSADPNIDPNATPIDMVSWVDFRKLVGDTWKPGANLPFDPIASKEAQQSSLRVICTDGRDIENLMAILRGDHFEGTVIG